MSHTLSTTLAKNGQRSRATSLSTDKIYANTNKLWNFEMAENHGKTKPKEQEPIPQVSFSKIEIKNQGNNSSRSMLTDLINHKIISLNYYKYVGEKQNVNDVLLDVKVHIPELHSVFSLTINSSVTIVELIGFALFNIEKNKTVSSDTPMDPNNWKLYLADEDGEIEDDFGVLDRQRSTKSYGADEFFIMKCTEDETKLNEKLTPSPLKQKDPSVEANEPFRTDETEAEEKEIAPVMINGSLMTLPANLTPGVSNNERGYTKSPAVNQINNDSSGEEELDLVGSKNDRMKMGKTYIRSEIRALSDKSGGRDKTKFKSATVKYKVKHKGKTSKTIQSILHNTAEHYQQTQKELFRGDEAWAYDTFGNKNSYRLDEDGDNIGQGLTYYRWNIWRRQQMSFKNKIPKILVLDGYQIYILPDNESEGASATNSTKSYNFSIEQVMKIKQNLKDDKFFKVVIKKNQQDIVKKYYLEARSGTECREIVSVIRRLASKYSENM